MHPVYLDSVSRPIHFPARTNNAFLVRYQRQRHEQDLAALKAAHVRFDMPIYASAAPLKTSPSPEHQQKAAKTIVKFLRKCRLPVDRLKKDTQAFSSLRAPHFEQEVYKTGFAIYKKRWAIAAFGKVESLSMRREIHHAVEALLQNRNAYQSHHIVPVYTVKGTGQLPEYRMMPASPRFFLLPGYTLPLTNPEDVAKLEKYIPTEEELHEIVKKFASQKDQYPWDFTDDGCYARCQLMLQSLRLMGIPKENLGKAILLYPARMQWSYHIAPIVKLQDGSWVCLDPAMNQEMATSLPEWARTSAPKGAPPPYNMGRCSTYTRFRYNPHRYNLLTTDYDKNITNVQTRFGNAEICPIHNRSVLEFEKTLGRYRWEKVDAPFIISHFPR